jgi:hypothetical protein
MRQIRVEHHASQLTEAIHRLRQRDAQTSPQRHANRNAQRDLIQRQPDKQADHQPKPKPDADELIPIVHKSHNLPDTTIR